MLDSISYLSHGKLSLPLQRYLLIDIDDIFVAERGTRMKPVDVEALLTAQENFQRLVPGFRFNLGFSGKYYHKGTPEENSGDDLLIGSSRKEIVRFYSLYDLDFLEKSNNFWWFCHMWSHSQPHLYNITVLEQEMKLNKEFAQVSIRKNAYLEQLIHSLLCLLETQNSDRFRILDCPAPFRCVSRS